MTDHPDESPSGDRPPWWQITRIRDHRNDKPPWWQTTLTTNHIDSRPPWWQTTLMRNHRVPWWGTTLMTIHLSEPPPHPPDRLASWTPTPTHHPWRTTLMTNHQIQRPPKWQRPCTLLRNYSHERYPPPPPTHPPFSSSFFFPQTPLFSKAFPIAYPCNGRPATTQTEPHKVEIMITDNINWERLTDINFQWRNGRNRWS